MEMQTVRLPGELPAEETIAAYEASPQHTACGEAEHLPQDWTETMNDCDGGRVPGSALEAERAAPEGKDVPSPQVQHNVPGEVLKRLSALHLAGQEVPSARGHAEHRRMPPFVHNHVDGKLHFHDARYPEPLSTEESPRRRARSLPWNSIPEADVEDEDDSLLCCCKLKKKVQFADSLGFSLASVKHFVPSDEPLVPQAVLARLQSYPPTVAVPRQELHPLENMCISEYPIPAELLARLDEQRVCLEQVSASSWGVSGYILAKDPGDSAQVKIRYTFNDWLSFLDCPASVVKPSTVPGTQRFHFSLCYPPSTSLLHFAICLTSGNGQEIWDNNRGANYSVSCEQYLLPEVQPSSTQQEECGGPQHW